MCYVAAIPIITALAAAASAGTAIYSATQDPAGDAAKQQQQQAAAAAAAAGTPQKATNADTSQTNTLNGPAAAGVNSGPASTLLTGAGGVDPNAIKTATGAMGLGSNTLLGS